jgi:hypothetical protein
MWCCEDNPSTRKVAMPASHEWCLSIGVTRPMAIRWRLQRAIPGAFYPELAVAV